MGCSRVAVPPGMSVASVGWVLNKSDDNTDDDMIPFVMLPRVWRRDVTLVVDPSSPDEVVCLVAFASYCTRELCPCLWWSPIYVFFMLGMIEKD